MRKADLRRAYTTALLCLALALPECLAQPVTIAPWMTGQRLVEMYEGRKSYETESAEKLREMLADAYVDGVHDATEGKGWCYSYKYKPKPTTIHEHVIWDLRAMPAEQLKRNAADLIVELLSKRYPCPADRSPP
jgi:Rap1a immunity proteins